MAGSNAEERAGVFRLYQDELLALVSLAMVGATHPGGTDEKARLAWALGCRAVEKAMTSLTAGSPQLVAPHLEAWYEWQREWRQRYLEVLRAPKQEG